MACRRSIPASMIDTGEGRFPTATRRSRSDPSFANRLTASRAGSSSLAGSPKIGLPVSAD